MHIISASEHVGSCKHPLGEHKQVRVVDCKLEGFDVTYIKLGLKSQDSQHFFWKINMTILKQIVRETQSGIKISIG